MSSIRETQYNAECGIFGFQGSRLNMNRDNKALFIFCRYGNDGHG
jgi:hypothetical protein